MCVVSEREREIKRNQSIRRRGYNDKMCVCVTKEMKSTMNSSIYIVSVYTTKYNLVYVCCIDIQSNTIN